VSNHIFLLRKKKTTTNFNAFCTKNPAIIPIVVGRLAAQTPSFLRVFSSMPDATINGGQHY
jgi:hypothetical protein